MRFYCCYRHNIVQNIYNKQQEMNLDRNIEQTFDLLNRVRTNPKEFVNKYQSHRDEYNGNIFRNIKTREGVSALNDLITQLQYRQPNSHQLKWNYGLHIIADRKATLLGSTGLITTQGTQHHVPILERAKDYIIVNGKISEVYQFGGQNGADIVEWLLMDDGLASRKRRLTLLDPSFHYIGIGSALHKEYGVITVIVLAQNAHSLVASRDNGTILKRTGRSQGLTKQIVVEQLKLNEKDKRQKLELGYSLVNNAGNNLFLPNNNNSSTLSPSNLTRSIKNRNNIFAN